MIYRFLSLVHSFGTVLTQTPCSWLATNPWFLVDPIKSCQYQWNLGVDKVKTIIHQNGWLILTMTWFIHWPLFALCMIPYLWLLHSCIHVHHNIHHTKISRNWGIICKYFQIMDCGRRNTKKYSFRCPDLKELRKLASFVLDPLDFKQSHEKLLSILSADVVEGLLSVLV